jgi:uncharacterized protein (DUF1697 family)
MGRSGGAAAGRRAPSRTPAVTAYVAMLRGINVSGRNKLSMTDLRQVFADAGCDDVRTYIQSGNVAFTSAAAPDTVVEAVERRLRGMVGCRVPVIIRGEDEIAAVVDGNPFLRRQADPAHLHVTFLADTPGAPAVEDLRARPTAPDAFEIVGRAVYLHCPDGYGRTKLTNAFFEKKLASEATTRNWRTVTTLVELVRRAPDAPTRSGDS